MKWPEQARVLRLIPGLEQAEFVRFGMVHRNTFINGPTVLRETWQTRNRPNLFFAGQISGVEGYVESAASGLIAGRNAARLALNRPLRVPPRTTAIGALAYYVSHANPKHYQPTNITFGIMAPDGSGRPPSAEEGRSQAGLRRTRARGSARWQRERSRSRSMRYRRVVDESAGRVVPRAPRLNENASDNTVRAYQSDLTQFVGFLAQQLNRRRGDVDPRTSIAGRFASFSRELHKRGNSRSSAARKLAAIRAFGRFLQREGVVDNGSGGARRHAETRAATASASWRR